MKGKVQTILGDVAPENLGRVLPHEHFEIDTHQLFLTPALHKPELKGCEISLRNLGWIRQYPYSSVSNMKFSGSEVRNAIFEEVKQFKVLGGGTIVDNTTMFNNTTRTLKNSDILSMKLEMSRSTGVNIVIGTGFYISMGQPESVLSMEEEAMVAFMTKELTETCEDYPTVKCGIAGEIGCSWPLTDFERRSLRAVAGVESSLGCPVMIHPGRSSRSPEEIVRIYTEAGGNPGRLVMGHLDRTIMTTEDTLEFASLNTLLEYDLFGIETSYYQFNEEIFMPSDGQRIERIKSLLQEGCEDRILVSHDIHTKNRLEHFGGHGYSHILKTVVPIMLKKGISQDTIDKITIHNPARWLTFIK